MIITIEVPLIGNNFLTCYDAYNKKLYRSKLTRKNLSHDSRLLYQLLALGLKQTIFGKRLK